ncbi:CLUMA_CG014330, isoform A [Clunio marinus]|uniref:CLUMA_CG014330, isoform A n=1 Tax=Clunio marinus TaxID=568069 RepID=A0A1J1IND6_9DIPT|nr:CLUMA_CG014330, isoform A [Clunio marinus]
MSESTVMITQIVLTFFDLGFSLCSVVGNSVVIYVISRDKKLKSKANYHILSVAFVDFLIGLLATPLGVIARITRAPHDFHQCVFLYSFIAALFAVSMLSLLAVSIDRCWAVCFPLTYHVAEISIAKVAIFFCWMIGIIVGFIPTFGWNSGEFYGSCDFRIISSMDYVLYVGVIIAVLALLLIITIYSIIYCVISRQARKRNKFNHKHAKRREEIIAQTTDYVKQKNEIRATFTLSMIVGTFVVLWTPGIVCFFVMAATQNRNISEDVMELTKSCLSLNAALDPLIYAYRMKNIRKAMNNLFKCCSNKKELQSVFTLSDKRSFKSSVRTLNDVVI